MKNFDERKHAICEKCEQREVCGFYLTPDKPMCEYLEHIKEGWEIGQADTLEEVELYVDRGNSEFTEEFINGLKQYLEGKDDEDD